MKHLKPYIKREDIPRVGDYVICHTEDNTEDKELINNSVGYFDRMFSSYYVITYDKKQKKKQWDSMYKDLDKISHYAYHYEIIHWSKNKEELEAILNANKFNL